jgi:hypothetical protein
MVIISLDLGLNLRATRRTPYLNSISIYGFPCACCEYVDSSLQHSFHFEPVLPTDFYFEWNAWALVIDILILLFVCFGTSILCEYLIRRREGRKP